MIPRSIARRVTIGIIKQPTPIVGVYLYSKVDGERQSRLISRNILINHLSVTDRRFYRYTNAY